MVTSNLGRDHYPSAPCCTFITEPNPKEGRVSAYQKKLVVIKWESTHEVELGDSLKAGDLVGFEYLQGITPEEPNFISASVAE